MRNSQGSNSTDPLFSEESFDEVEKPKSRRVIQSILVVDPDSGFSSTVSDYLKLFGYNICYRTEIDDAVDYAIANNSDVIFLADNFDFHHPIDVLRKFKELVPGALIAILANRGDDQLAVELLKAGADDYLSRRVKDKDILTSIASLLEQLGSEPKNIVQSRGVRTDFVEAQEKALPSFLVNAEQNTQLVREQTEIPEDLGLINDKMFSPESNKFDTQLSAKKPITTHQRQEFSVAMLEQMPGVMMVINQQMQILKCNSNCVDFLGLERSSIIGRAIDTIVAKQFYLDLTEQMKLMMQNEDNQNFIRSSSLFEMVMINADNVGVPVRCKLTCSDLSQTDLSLSQLSREERGVQSTQGEINYLLAIEDLSQEKAKQAELLYHSMWSNLLRAFAHRFINLKLENFSQELSSVVAETANFFKLDRVSIYLFDKNQSKAKIYLEWLKKDIESLKIFSKKIDVESSLTEFNQLLSGHELLLTPVSTVKNPEIEECGGLSEHYAQVDTCSTLVLPIRKAHQKNNNVIGWIALDHQKPANQWHAKDKELLEPLGLLISEAFTRRSKEEQRKVTHQKLSENHGRLSEQAFLDGLTKLANRRYFDKVLESEVRRASRDKSNIALLFCDVDFFKVYNDTYGHLEGDVCLKAIAAIMKQEFQRAGDFVARFGGEEFAIVLSGSLANDAQEAAERLRKQIESMNLEHSGVPLGKITISIGISSVIAPQPNDAKKLLSKADKALYKAKSKGRNRVEIAKFSPR